MPEEMEEEIREMRDAKGKSVFGAIESEIVPA